MAATNGLRLAGTVIHQLGGPVYTALLRPPKPVFSQWADEGIALPVLLLLGEDHEQFYECLPCEEAAGCLTMRNTEFMKRLEVVARKTPVDVHFELSSYDLHPDPTEFAELSLYRANVPAPENIVSIVGNATKAYFSDCFGPQKGAGCPTPCLRYHYSDARTFRHRYEFYCGNMAIDVIGQLAKDIIAMGSGNMMVHTFSSLYPSWVASGSGSASQAVQRGHAQLAELYRVALMGTTNEMDEMHEQYYRRVMDDVAALPAAASVIKKQLLKLPVALQGVDMWRNGIFDAIFSVRNMDQLMLNELDDIRHKLTAAQRQRFLDILLRMIRPGEAPFAITITDVQMIIPHLNALSTVAISVTVYLLDVYSMMRMIKPPTGGIAPTLVVSFAGAKHSLITASLFRSIFTYDQVYEYNAGTLGASCIEWQAMVDLDGMVDDIHQWRFPQQVLTSEDRASLAALDAYRKCVPSQTKKRKASTHPNAPALKAAPPALKAAPPAAPAIGGRIHHIHRKSRKSRKSHRHFKNRKTR